MSKLQSLSPELTPLSPITIKITTTTKTMTYHPNQPLSSRDEGTSMDSLNGLELPPVANQMYSIAEHPIHSDHEYQHEHGFGTNTNSSVTTVTEPTFMD